MKYAEKALIVAVVFSGLAFLGGATLVWMVTRELGEPILDI